MGQAEPAPENPGTRHLTMTRPWLQKPCKTVDTKRGVAPPPARSALSAALTPENLRQAPKGLSDALCRRSLKRSLNPLEIAASLQPESHNVTGARIMIPLPPQRCYNAASMDQQPDAIGRGDATIAQGLRRKRMLCATSSHSPSFCARRCLQPLWR